MKKMCEFMRLLIASEAALFIVILGYGIVILCIPLGVALLALVDKDSRAVLAVKWAYSPMKKWCEKILNE